MSETLSGQVESVRIIREGWGTISLLYGSDSERAAVVGHPLDTDVVIVDESSMVDVELARDARLNTGLVERLRESAGEATSTTEAA